MASPTVVDRLRRHPKWVLGICGAVIVAATVVFTIRIALQDGYSDFLVYYQTSRRLLGRQWGEVYRLADHYDMFRYHPLALPLFWPWALWDYTAARQAFYASNLLAGVAGFYWIARALKADRVVVAVTALLTLRFFLDGWWMGQVVGWMSAGVGLFFCGLVRGRTGAAALGLWLPVVMKVGLGILAPMSSLAKPLKFWMGVAGWAGAISLGSGVWILSVTGWAGLIELLTPWKATVDSVLTPTSVLYWDCKDFRSQAINSALLRMSAWGWWDVHTAYYLWLGSVAVGLVGLGFLVLRQRHTRPDTVGLARLTSLGVMAYLLLMPFTYRHTLALMVLPIMTLLLHGSRPRSYFWLGFVALVALGGSTPWGTTLAYWIQEVSVPTAMMVWMTGALARDLRHAASHS